MNRGVYISKDGIRMRWVRSSVTLNVLKYDSSIVVMLEEIIY